MGIHSILEAFDDSSCFHYFIRKTMNQVSTKNTNKNKRSIHQYFGTCCISVLLDRIDSKKYISQECPSFGFHSRHHWLLKSNLESIFRNTALLLAGSASCSQKNF